MRLKAGFAAVAAALGMLASTATAATAATVPSGKYGCYMYAGATPNYTGVTIVIKGGTYTTAAGGGTGSYRLSGSTVAWVGGPLRGIPAQFKVTTSVYSIILTHRPGFSVRWFPGGKMSSEFKVYCSRRK
jgi:hypothetical protein